MVLILFMIIAPAQAENEPAIRQMLAQCGLPFEDITPELLRHFFVAQDDGEVIGCAGLEPRGNAALFRSLAVASNYRGSGLGKRLVAHVEKHAQTLSVQSLYLLTIGAEGFFTRIGYSIVDRGDAPRSIQETEEFASLCPSSSTCMVKRLAV